MALFDITNPALWLIGALVLVIITFIFILLRLFIGRKGPYSDIG